MRNFQDLEFPVCILCIGIALALVIAAASMHSDSKYTNELKQLKQRIEKLEQSTQR